MFYSYKNKLKYNKEEENVKKKLNRSNRSLHIFQWTLEHRHRHCLYTYYTQVMRKEKEEEENNRFINFY